MSAAPSKPGVEQSSTTSAFSYAQAAKGGSSSGPATIQGGKPASSHEMTTKAPSPSTTTATTPLADASDITNKYDRTSEEAPKNGGQVNGTLPSEEQSDLSRSKSKSPSPQRNVTTQPQVLTSTPSSPSFGTASTSTLPKEDDISSTLNASSDSTWDRQSQTSHSPEKVAIPVEAEKEGEKEKGQSWEKETAKPAPFKPAPPPTLNVWQQRREAQEAKAKANSLSTPHQTMKTQGVGVGTGSTSGQSNINTARIPDQTKSDMKKKGRSSNSQGDELPTSSAANANKRKGIDGKDRIRDEGKDLLGQTGQPFLRSLADDVEAAKKMVPRPSHSPDTSRDARPPLAPPPAEDPTSWPTPDTAQDEEKKKTVERGEKVEKEKSPAVRPHGKEKWMPVPYVPSAIFNTPLPNAARRGGRPARGGREVSGRGGSHAANSSMSGDKWSVGQNGSVPSSGIGETHDRGRDELGGGKSAAVPLRPKQRAMSAGAATLREQRKPVEFATLTKRRDEPAPQPQSAVIGAFDGRRRTSIAAQAEHSAKSRQDNRRLSRSEGSGIGSATQMVTERAERDHGASGETHAHPRSAGADRRSEGSFRPVEYFRDTGNNLGPRERGEGRFERGRGGFRNLRGANNGVSSSHHGASHHFFNGHTSHHPNVPAYSTSKSHSYNERLAQQQGSQYGLPPQHSRNYRSGSRSQSIPNSAVYGRFPNGVQNGVHPLPPIQTDVGGVYGYQTMHPGIMSAMPFNPYVEQMSVIGVVSMQLEYYFSVDNLCKDMFLRKHMDSQGFVFLSIIANFNRIKQLTQDMELVRYVCFQSPNIEFRTGPDGVDRLRKRDGWQQWVLSMEERDPSAQNDGPAQVQQPRIPRPQMVDMHYASQSRLVNSSLDASNGFDNIASDAHYQSPNGNAPSFVPIVPSSVGGSSIIDAHLTQTPLSAAVPDFSPGTMPVNDLGMVSLNNHPREINAFTDEQVDNLVIVIRKQGNNTNSSRPPFHMASSRTFSNGSIDGRTITDEMIDSDERQQSPPSNGTSRLENHHRPRTPLPWTSPTKQVDSNASPVFWVKDKDTPIDSLPNDLTHESYNGFRENALEQRKLSAPGNCHRDMDVLYQFWSHFLIRNFNTRMYDEFRELAFDDALQHQSNVGVKNLIQYYDEAIASQKVISDEIARDFVDLVKGEATVTDRPAFTKLRAAWRNGAFNMKNRKKIDNLIDQDLRADLER